MRRAVTVFVLAIGLTWAGVALAQVPRTMSYQGTLTDASGTPVADGAYTLAFGLYTAASGGAAIFAEQQSVSVTDGAFSAIIGVLTAGGIPASIPFTGQYYLGISVNGAAELTPRTALTASPYALNAVTSTGLLLPAVQTASSAAPLLSLTNTSPDGSGVFGVHTATTGNGAGVRGETASTGFYAAGVYGVVTAADAGAGSAGVWGSNAGTEGNGVYGGHSGGGVGVQGYSASGRGILGMSNTGRAGHFLLTHLSNASNALEAETGGTGSAGLFQVTNAASSAAALQGETSASSGIGVLGVHSATGGNGAGVRGTTASTAPLATGVFGVVTATGASGANSAGVQGWHWGSGSGGAGVRGYQAGLGAGVEGYAPSGTAISGTSHTGRAAYFGVDGAASASNAVEAETGGTGSAGLFRVTNAASSAAALQGTTSGSGIGVRGTTGGPGAGVYGISGTGPGVAGSSDSFIGVRGWGDSSTGIGVAGYHTATTGGNPGVLGQSNSTVGGIGVSGSGSGLGVGGYSLSGVGVQGSHQGSTGTDPGARGQTYSTDAFATGVEGVVLSTAPGGGSAAVRGTNNGTGGSGIGVYGYQAGSGYGVQGETPAGRGVFGASTSGYGVYGTSTSGTGVFGSGTSGTGVNATTSTGSAVFAIAFGAGSNAVLADHLGASGNIVLLKSDGSNVARIDKTGKGFFNGGTQTGGADLAEAFEVEGDREAYEAGDVLAISTRSDRTLKKSSAPNSTLVAGVYATKPGLLLTDFDIDADASHRVPLGVVGVIPTKVSAENGAIHRGDLLVTAATPAHAMKAGATPAIGTVLGKALQDFAGPGTGVINVLVNVK